MTDKPEPKKAATNTAAEKPALPDKDKLSAAVAQVAKPAPVAQPKPQGLQLNSQVGFVDAQGNRQGQHIGRVESIMVSINQPPQYQISWVDQDGPREMWMHSHQLLDLAAAQQAAIQQLVDAAEKERLAEETAAAEKEKGADGENSQAE